MAFKALLTIDDFEDFEEVNVLHCDFEFSRKIDIKTGHILSQPQAGLVHLTVESTRNTSLLDWLLRAERHDGTVLFKAEATRGPMNSKRLTFSKAVCVDYREVFEANTGDAMRCFFSIWCQQITVGDSEHAAIWMDESGS